MSLNGRIDREKKDNHIGNEARRVPLQWHFTKLFMGFQSYFAFLFGRVLFSSHGRNKDNQGTIPDKVRAILVVRLDGVGDLVMTTSFLKELRQLYQEAHIVLVVKKDLFNIVELCPYVDEFHILNTRSSQIMQPIVLPWRAFLLARTCLVRHSFDLAINPRWDTDGNYAGFVTYFSNATWRLAYSEAVDIRKQYFNRGFNRLYTTLINNREPKHEIERGMDILEFLGGYPRDRKPEVWLSQEDHEYPERLCNAVNLPFWVALAPGAGRSSKMWPLENFVNVATWLRQHRDAGIIILGSSNERTLGESIINKAGQHTMNLAGQTTLRQAAAIIKKCNLFLGNDSGLVHLASAVGTPIVEISCHPLNGSVAAVNSPLRFGPWSDHKIIVQPPKPLAPCRERCEATKAHCITQIKLNDVLNAIDTISTKPPLP